MMPMFFNIAASENDCYSWCQSFVEQIVNSLAKLLHGIAVSASILFDKEAEEA